MTKQGFSLSGALYTLCIEPFLCLIRRSTGIECISLAKDMRPMRVSAYADDVNLFISNDCFDRIFYCIDLYSKSSNSSVNYSKSCL